MRTIRHSLSRLNAAETLQPMIKNDGNIVDNEIVDQPIDDTSTQILLSQGKRRSWCFNRVRVLKVCLIYETSHMHIQI